MLSDEQSKEIYDERLILSSSIHNPYKLTNIKRGVYIFFDNFTSRVLLFFARIRRGQWIEELEDLTEIIRSHRVWNTKRNARLLVKKFVLLPSWFDRMVLLGEYFWMLKFEAMFAIFSILALSSLPSMNGGDTYYYDNI